MESNKKKNRLVQIMVPLLIVVAVVGIWIVKNNEKKAFEAPQADNADFALSTQTLDLEQLKTYGLPIMLDFGSDDCVPCRQMAPVLAEVNAEYQGTVIVKYMDVWADQSLADGFPLEVIPTQFFFTADGKPFVPSNPEAMGMIIYTRKDTGEHVYTAHQGGLTKEQVVSIFAEMGVK